MYIKDLHISAFGPVLDADYTFGKGLNIIEGANESGKSAIATFIKFIFYGLSSRSTDGISDRQRYVNWSRGYAAGHAVCVIEDGGSTREVRIERTLNAKTDGEGRTKYSEKVRVLDHASSMPMNISGQPGEFFFGVPENVFTGSAYAAQEGDIKPDGASLKESVENIICAADESINVKRASDSLDRARIRLLHKNRTGGEIRDLEKKRDALESRVISDRETSAKLIKAEISLSDVKENIESAENRRAELEDIAKAIEILAREARLIERISLEEKREKTKEELKNGGFDVVDDKMMSSLAVAYRDIDRAEKQKAEFRRVKDEYTKKFPYSDGSDPTADVENALKTGNKADLIFSVGCALTIVGLVGTILTAVLNIVASAGLYLPLILTVPLVVAGIVLLIRSRGLRNSYYDVLDAWDADDEDDLRAAAEDATESFKRLDEAKAALAASEQTAKEADATVASLAKVLGVSAPAGTALIKAVAKAAAEKTKKKSELEAELSRVEGQLAATPAENSAEKDELTALADSVRGTEAGKTAASMSDKEKSEVSRELAFNRTKSANLRDRELELERECAALRATTVAPANAAEELDSIKDELVRLRRAHDALILAGETLSTAGENIRSSVVPRLTAEASATMSRVSGGRYSAIGISPSFDMNFRDDTFGTLELDYLSSGTKDMAYIALRLALVKALYEKDARPPVIFDESLAFLDEDRVRKALKILSDEEVQTFLFTCRSLERNLSEDAQVITLSRR